VTISPSESFPENLGTLAVNMVYLARTEDWYIKSIQEVVESVQEP
jgi:hypothetical protein